jgi:DNA-binding transcriptional regulator YiaG
MERSWKDNALEFGSLSKLGYDVRLALLVACSVDSSPTDEKVTASKFASQAGVSAKTVVRYLTAWDKMVAAGWDVPRDKLTPAMALVLELPDSFVAEFDAIPKGGHVLKADELGITPGAAAIVNSSAESLTAAIQADPKTAATAAKALAKSAANLSADDLDDLQTAVLNEKIKEPKFAGAMEAGDKHEAKHKETLDKSEAQILLHSAMTAISRLGDMHEWVKLYKIRDFLGGVLEASDADDLTPEMFTE